MFGIREGCIDIPGVLEVQGPSVFTNIVSANHVPEEIYTG